MILVFDIGATNTRLGLAQGKRLLRTISRPTPKDPAAAVRLLAALAMLLQPNVRLTKAIGGVPKPVNLPQWRSFDFAKALTRTLRVPVTCENDAALAGLGEAVFGAGRGSAIVMYMNVGTGVNGVKIEHGHIDENASGFEIGHQTISLESKAPRCSCGGRGHLEAYIGGWAYKKYPFTAQQRLHALATGLYNSILHWSPNLVVLGGAMIQNRVYDLSTLRSNMRMRNTLSKQVPPIRKGRLGDEAGLWGALAYERPNAGRAHALALAAHDSVL